MDQTFFHMAFVAIFITFLAIRVAYHRLAMRSRGKVEYKESKRFIAVRFILALLLVPALFAYMFQPDILSWAALSLPEWMRWLGVLLGLASLPLLLWVHWALGSNFSGTLHVREEHTLVTHGPYRWVRHPMYSVFYVFMLSILLMTANWLVGGVSLLALTLVMVARLKNEEATMIEKFGDRYREYMRRTG